MERLKKKLKDRAKKERLQVGLPAEQKKCPWYINSTFDSDDESEEDEGENDGHSSIQKREQTPKKPTKPPEDKPPEDKQNKRLDTMDENKQAKTTPESGTTPERQNSTHPLGYVMEHGYDSEKWKRSDFLRQLGELACEPWDVHYTSRCFKASKDFSTPNGSNCSEMAIKKKRAKKEAPK
ncbi:uncharacterized protein TrAtP1_002340 [Trichoderma atroviride]|uniref:Uncharacterized protein n=1 Tax=Hypocrea atroviridis (strain ATCC 20476 / IMI 206040) TaxID=452589 RepID=G9P231_HYPAI|nr:uncharacterized protein TRIATDRAFT_86501 [Trichoderma atroviride IMI 206040]EHK42626.1 hypothetical protein TRIATDRAFT_86501 [Trichoderma atroviride IMI 206040]UKZ61068.1 hypothetical protein TrAtP1_002340 [Trichoderma atroviride]